MSDTGHLAQALGVKGMPVWTEQHFADNFDGCSGATRAYRGAQKRSYEPVRGKPRNRAAAPEDEAVVQDRHVQRLVLAVTVTQALRRERLRSA